MSFRSRALGSLMLCLLASIVSVWLLLPYVITAPRVLILPLAVVVLSFVVFWLEASTVAHARALLVRDPSVQIASWDYSEADWAEVVRALRPTGYAPTLATTIVSSALVTLVAGLATDDARSLLLGAAWAVVWSTASLGYGAYREAELASDPRRRLWMTRSFLLVGPRLYVLNPEPALAALGADTHLLACTASSSPAASSSSDLAGLITWTCVALARNSRRRIEHRLPIPADRVGDVDRVLATYLAIAAPNRADPRLTLPS